MPGARLSSLDYNSGQLVASVFQSWSLLLDSVGAENSLPVVIISFAEVHDD